MSEEQIVPVAAGQTSVVYFNTRPEVVTVVPSSSPRLSLYMVQEAPREAGREIRVVVPEDAAKIVLEVGKKGAHASVSNYLDATAQPRQDILPAPSSSPRSGVAAVQVILPDPNATLFVDGRKMHLTGSVRHFQTPALNPGETYRYQVKALWRDGHRVIADEKSIAVTPGETTVVNFASAADGILPVPNTR